MDIIFGEEREEAELDEFRGPLQTDMDAYLPSLNPMRILDR